MPVEYVQKGREVVIWQLCVQVDLPRQNRCRYGKGNGSKPVIHWLFATSTPDSPSRRLHPA